MRDHCPQCNRALVKPNGPVDADVLIVGEFPGEEEVITGLPFVGRTGDVLRYELAVSGITLERCRVTNLWLHDKSKAQDDECLNLGMSAMLQELYRPRKGVLFLGSELPPLFGLPPVTTISGIMFDEIPMIGVPYPCMFLPNPAIVFHSSVGEIRHGLYVFSQFLKGNRVFPNV